MFQPRQVGSVARARSPTLPAGPAKRRCPPRSGGPARPTAVVAFALADTPKSTPTKTRLLTYQARRPWTCQTAKSPLGAGFRDITGFPRTSSYSNMVGRVGFALWLESLTGKAFTNLDCESYPQSNPLENPAFNGSGQPSSGGTAHRSVSPSMDSCRSTTALQPNDHERLLFGRSRRS